MLHDLELGGEFFEALFACDEAIAEQVARAGCRHCGGPLYRSNYERKPRGAWIAGAGEAFSLRHSLCCGREGCRRRALPPSLRFLGRRVYLEAVVLLASAVALLSSSLGRARARTGVPVWTLRRWARWWTEALPASRTWQELRAAFAPPPPDEGRLPTSLLERLGIEPGQAGGGASLVPAVCRQVAVLLAPMTTSSVLEEPRFVRAVTGPSGPERLAQKM
jgi:hypothetical protein